MAAAPPRHDDAARLHRSRPAHQQCRPPRPQIAPRPSVTGPNLQRRDTMLPKDVARRVREEVGSANDELERPGRVMRVSGALAEWVCGELVYYRSTLSDSDYRHLVAS